MRAKEARPTPRALTFAIVALLFLGSVLLVAEMTAAAAVTVPYAANPVADVDLDGDPATGDWTGSTTTTVPLENGQGGGYGTATLRAKHDGTVAYYRLDGQIDVPWTSAGGNHFWLGWQVSPADTTHHGGGTWDGAFFGLWDGTDYAPQPSYPPAPVDTFGFQRPPTADASQDLLGRLRYSGASAPYAFTAEWKKALNTGDADDLVYVADGTTVYNFFSTTDSNGAGSGGGGINHRGTTNTNTLVFAAPPGNSPPAVDLTSPDGGEDWTGGSAHTIFWNMSDVETATPSLKVWLNYSTNGGLAWSAIAGAQGITGLSSPSSFAWTVPAVDTAQARVRATVVDGSGTATSDTSAANFQIDSMSPTATGTPTGGGVSVNTWVNVSFSEAMAQASAQGAFELRRVSDWALVPTVSQGWVGNVMRYSPASALAFTTTYQGNVSTAAKDASRPGNALGTPYTFTFTTQTPADTQPPSVVNVAATPDPQETGLAVNLTADVTDNIAVAGAWVEVFDPGAALLGNFSMGMSLPPTYFHEAVYSTLGTYTFMVWARDTAANWASAGGSFVIQDTIPPMLSGVTAIPSPQQAGLPVNVSAAVSDSGVITAVTLDLVDPTAVPSGPFAMVFDAGSGRYYRTAPYGVVGTWQFTITATDWAANTATALGSFDILDGTPPEIFHTPVSGGLVSVPILISAQVVDGGGVALVRLNYTDVGAVNQNVTMVLSGGLYEYTIPGQATTGTVCYFLWAMDDSANTNRTPEYCFPVLGSDTTPPTLVGVAATPDPQETGLAVNLTADVTDNIAVAGAWVEVFDPGAALLGNFSMGYDIPSAAYFHSAAYVPLGLYTFQVHATDSSGNWASGSGTFLVRDSMPPTIRGLAAAPDPQETGLPVNITATVTDTVAVQSVSAGVTDPLGAPLGNLTMSRLGATDTYFLEQAYALVGVYGVALWASDPAGNFATASTTFTIVDTQPPAVLWVSATPPVQEPGLPVNLTAGVTDNRAVQSVTANVTDPGGVPVGNFTMAPLASPDYAYEAPYTTLGVYGVVVWALDASGNTASASSSFEVRDQQPPVITHTPPASVPVGVAIRVTAQVTDNVAVADVRLDFTDVSASRFNVSMGLNLTQYEIDIPGQPSPGLVTYFLWAIDGSGNVRITSTFTVAVLAPDTAPPSISGVAATPSPQNIGGTVTLTAGVTDNVGVAGVWVEVHGPGGGLVGNTSAASSGGTYSLAAAYVAVGTYTFQFAAVDTSGNWAVASGTFVIADLEPPVANAGPDRVIWIGTATVLDGTASTDNVLVTGFVWTFTYRGAPITLSSSVASFRFDEAGIYAVTLTVSDAAGWTETDAVTVTVVRDTTPPPVPSGIVLQPGAADCLGLTWIPSVADDLAGYSVYRYNATSERFERVGNLTAAELAFHDCGLAPGVEYLYWVVAVDENGTVSAPSVIVHRALPSTPTTPTTPEPMPYLLLGVFVLPAGLVIFALRRRRKGEPQEATAPSDSPTAADAPSEVPEASLPGPTREEWPPPP